MRNLIWTLGVITLSATIAAGSSKGTDCVRRLSNEINGTDTISIVTTNHETIRAVQPIGYASATSLYVRTVGRGWAGSHTMIPRSTIQQISYQKPSPARGVVTTLGFLAGSVAGVAAGVALAPEPRGFMDWPQIPCGIIGGTIGAIVGAAAGLEIGKHWKTTVTLRCNW